MDHTEQAENTKSIEHLITGAPKLRDSGRFFLLSGDFVEMKQIVNAEAGNYRPAQVRKSGSGCVCKLHKY